MKALFQIWDQPTIHDHGTQKIGQRLKFENLVRRRKHHRRAVEIEGDLRTVRQSGMIVQLGIYGEDGQAQIDCVAIENTGKTRRNHSCNTKVLQYFGGLLARRADPHVRRTKHYVASARIFCKFGPEFAENARAGDVMLGAPNMGVGSSREQAAEVLKHLGIAAVIAPSFAGIFYRNAINLGLPVFTIDAKLHDHPGLTDGAEITFDFDSASVMLPASDKILELEPLPDFLRAMIMDGGLIPYLEKRFHTTAAAEGA